MKHLNIKTAVAVVIFLALSARAAAQVTISNGEHVVQISTVVAAYYNHRFLKDDDGDKKNNRFKLRDAQLKIDGRYRDTWRYELQVDLADLAAGNAGVIDPENVGLMDANVTYKGLGFVAIKAGYGKLPYSRSSIMPFYHTPYWQRAELVRGDIFSRRDVGVTLSADIWRYFSVDAGVYTGLGELSLSGKNDASGKPEYVGRAEFSFPCRYRFREVDQIHVPTPMFSIGGNIRYADKTQPDGKALPDYAAGEYGLKVINGKKLVYGFDFTFLYEGFSAQFELHQIKAQPSLATDPLYQGMPLSKTNGYVMAGGYLAQLNYFIKPISTIVSARYEVLDLNDLVPGNSKRFAAALAYQVPRIDAMIRLQYFKILGEESIDPLKWSDQLRLGVQVRF